MNKYILLISILLCIVGCGKLNIDKEVDKSKLLGYDYRLFQNTPAWELAKAVWNNDYKKIVELTNNNKELINYREPKYGQTLLFLAMWNNQKETFKFLISHGANINVYDTFGGSSPIIEACEYNVSIDFVKILLQNGANPNDIEIGGTKNNDGFTPLINAVRFGNFDLVEFLLQNGVDINYQNKFGRSALSRAIRSDEYQIALFLLKKGADFNVPVHQYIPEERQVYITEALRRKLPRLNSKEHKLKMKIVDFLEQKGVSYKHTPVPKDVLGKIKRDYPNSWKEYVDKY